MPLQDSKTSKDTTSTGQISPDDKALREDWKKLSPEDQDTYFKSLPADDQEKFATRVGLFDSKLPITISAHPKTGSIPWMKEKAYQFLNWGANQLPTIGGVAGGIAGGAVGEGANPIGGGVPGALIGSGVGGAVGDAGRQYVQHKTGADQFEDPDTKTLSSRLLSMTKQGAGQMAAEATGQLGGKLLRPTLERSLSKLYYAGGLKHGAPLGPGDLETVMNDLLQTEKGGQGKATTVGDFIHVIEHTKNDIGREVDNQMALPITQNGRTVMLGQARADTIPIANAINSKATSDPSIVKMAKLSPAGKEAAYLEYIRQEVLNFSKADWTYTELMDRRIKLNNELAPLYTLPPGEQRVYLLDHPHLAVAKAEADAIRDVIYPKMDYLAGNPLGTTAELQGKRGALMSLETQVNDHLSVLKTKARQAKGAPMTEKANISTYGTTGGRPGIAMHRLSSLVHTPNPERAANSQVKKAFGHGIGTNTRRLISTPFGSEKLGDEILSMPLRELVNPAQPKKPEENDSSGPQSSVVKPKDLIEKAKQLNPSGEVAYNHVAVNPATGHKIGSKDGQTWFDLQSGAKVA